MDSRRVGAVAAVATLLSLAVRWGPSFLLGQQIDSWRAGGAAGGTLPLIGSVGQTVSTYLYAVRAVELLAPLVVGVVLGVWLARRVECDELGAGLRAVATGSAAVVAIPVLAAIVVWSGFDLANLAMAMAMSLTLIAAGPVFVTVAAAAGVALETVGVLEKGAGGQETDQDAATTEHEPTA